MPNESKRRRSGGAGQTRPPAFDELMRRRPRPAALREKGAWALVTGLHGLASPPSEQLQRLRAACQSWRCSSGRPPRFFFDGGAKGNPGPAGSGAVLYSPESNIEVWSASAWIGDQGTNNEAEYVGVLMALNAAGKLGLETACITGDSELVVKQLRGEYKVNAKNLKPLFEMAKALETRYGLAVEYQHVLRSGNARADELANTAMATRQCSEVCSSVSDPLVGTGGSSSSNSKRTSSIGKSGSERKKKRQRSDATSGGGDTTLLQAPPPTFDELMRRRPRPAALREKGAWALVTGLHGLASPPSEQLQRLRAACQSWRCSSGRPPRFFFDGGAKGNPGPAGSGAVLYSPESNIEVWSASAWIGDQGTNNEAEYVGVLMALNAAGKLGLETACITGDSELVVKQLRGEYKVNAKNLKPLFEMAKALETRYGLAVEYQHVLRSGNARADELANTAMATRQCSEVCFYNDLF